MDFGRGGGSRRAPARFPDGSGSSQGEQVQQHQAEQQQQWWPPAPGFLLPPAHPGLRHPSGSSGGGSSRRGGRSSSGGHHAGSHHGPSSTAHWKPDLPQQHIPMQHQQQLGYYGTPARGCWPSSTTSFALVPVQCVVMQTGPPIYCSASDAARWYASGAHLAATPTPPPRYHNQHQLKKLPAERGSKGGSQCSTVDDHSSIASGSDGSSATAVTNSGSGSSSSTPTISIAGALTETTAVTVQQVSDGEEEDSSVDEDFYGSASQGSSTTWGDLTVGILQTVLAKLSDSDVKSLRQVCRHWRAAVDQNLEALTPNSLKSKTVTLRFPNLRLLQLTNCAVVRNRDLQLLSRSGLRLHTLVIGDDANKPWVTNLGLSWIGKITTLTSLSLQDCTQVTNKGMAFLGQLSSLATLSLRGCARLTNQGLEALQSHTGLTSLNLAGCRRVSDKGLVPLTRLPALLHLALGNTRIGDEGMGYLAQITSLHELQFAREAMTDYGIKQLSTLTNLQTLALRECAQVSGDALSQLVPKLYNLQSLDLFQSYEFDDSQLAKCLDFLGSLTCLDLRGTVVTEEGLQQLARLQNLQKLCLAPKQEMRVEQHLCVLSHLTQLTSLAINNCQLVSFDLMKSLMHLKLLRELDISNCDQVLVRQQDMQQVQPPPAEPVAPQAIEAVANITSLTSVDVSRRLVREEHLAVLAERLPRLRTLFVVGCPVLYEQLQELHRRFPELIIHRKPVHDPPMSCSSSEL